MKNTKLAQARLGACRRWPAATAAILSLVPVERADLGTLAVDAHWRLYFDPVYLESVLSEEAEGIILHEVSHLLLKHHSRGGAATDWELWNAATDCSINERLRAEGHPLPPGCLLPETFQLPPNKTAEHYYHELNERQDAKQRAQSPSSDKASQQDQSADVGPDSVADDQRDPEAADQAAEGGDQAEGGSVEAGTGGDSPDAVAGKAGRTTDPDPAAASVSPVSPGTSGSCSDGQQRPWEAPAPRSDAPDDYLPPAMAKHEQEQVLRDVAERIAKQVGTGAGSWSTWAKEVISPRIDPKALLVAAVRQAIEQTAGGHDDTSYRRPSRRPAAGGIIRPSRVALVPRICLIVDSSGSMNQRDLGLALGLIAKVLSGFRLRDGVQVLVGDAAVQSCEKVFDPKKLLIKGGGGTEIDHLIAEAAKLEPRPQLIVVATDGYTAWPRESVGIPVVACLTRDEGCGAVPRWIKSVVLA